ncbi:MAG TPA: hypothetical protein DHW39_11525 [Erysipelotrichaceae bacterium]|nr:hypothetical protein [Erysipelotrichaceae bacterium]
MIHFINTVLSVCSVIFNSFQWIVCVSVYKKRTASAAKNVSVEVIADRGSEFQLPEFLDTLLFTLFLRP